MRPPWFPITPKWDDTPVTLSHFAESAVRAYTIAMTPPQEPVILIADGELQEEPIVEKNLRVPKLVVSAAGDTGAMAEAVRLPVAAENPVIVAERQRTPRALRVRPAGKRLFLKNGCYQCHGQSGLAGARLSQIKLSQAAFTAYVRNPPPSGMPPYRAKVMSDQELADVWAYIRTSPEPPPASSIPILNP